MSGGLKESWMGIFNVDLPLLDMDYFWFGVFRLYVSNSGRRMKQRPQERLVRLFQGLSNTPVMGAEVLLWALNAPRTDKNLWWPPSPVLESRKQIPALGCQQEEELGWFFLCWQLSEQVFFQNRDLHLIKAVDLERSAVGALEGVRPDDCKKDSRLVVDDRVRTRDLSKLIYVKYWWIFRQWNLLIYWRSSKLVSV